MATSQQQQQQQQPQIFNPQTAQATAVLLRTVPTTDNQGKNANNNANDNLKNKTCFKHVSITPFSKHDASD
jgi:hypothetical protein